jgi:hypothetical protein
VIPIRWRAEGPALDLHYLPVTLNQGIALGLLALVAMVIAFYSTRRAAKLVEA